MTNLTTLYQPDLVRGNDREITVYYTVYNASGKAFRRQRTFADDMAAAEFIDTERVYGSRITKIEQHW